MSKKVDPKILELSLSKARLSTYLNAVQADIKNAEARAIELYLWNAEISAAFMLPLQICEITLRNAVAEAIATTYGENWPWHPSYQGSLPSKQLEVLKNVRKAHKEQNVNKIIPELSFSFWQNMLTKRHDERIWNQHLETVFPGAKSKLNEAAHYRDKMHKQLDKIRKLRNRIAHHEPVFQYNLTQSINDILQVVRYRCPATAAWLELHHTVNKVFKAKPAVAFKFNKQAKRLGISQ